MLNQFDVGAQQDYDAMTEELGSEISVYLKKYDLGYEGQEGEDSKNRPAVKEIAFLQELDTKHEMVNSGQLSVGDVRISFKSDTVANEECQILANGKTYKVLKEEQHFFDEVKTLQKRKGKLIVIDGGDGSGKATQSALLKSYLEKHGKRVKYMDFPRYYNSFHGRVVGRFLTGEFGALDQVSPYLAALAYALDRASAKEEMDNLIDILKKCS